MQTQISLSQSVDATKYKISVIGDMAVGKTCLALRFVNDTFRDNHKATISDIETKTVSISGNNIVFQIWDTAGQERFKSLLPLYMKGIDGAIVVYDVTSEIWDTVSKQRYRFPLPLYMKGIDGAMVVYDVTSKPSYNHVGMWISEVRKYSPDNTVIMLVGNKIDIVRANEHTRQVSKEVASDKSLQSDILFLEASAKSGENVEKIFMDMGKEIMKRKNESRISFSQTCVSLDAKVKLKNKCC